MIRPSTALDNSKGFGLDMTRSTLNYRPSSRGNRESSLSRPTLERMASPKIDMIFNSGLFSAVENSRRSRNTTFADAAILKMRLTRSQNRGPITLKTLPTQSTNNQVPQRLRELKDLVHSGVKEIKKRVVRPSFISVFADSNFQSIDYSLVPKDQVLNRLFKQLDFSLTHFIGYMAHNLPKKYYKFAEVQALFDQDFRSTKSAAREHVVTKEMVLHEFVPQSQILKLKLFNKDRLDSLAPVEFGLKTRVLISEVLKRSFTK
jgi:hypothetical protein